MSREFEYIPWLKFVIFFFLPSLEKTFCKNKRKKEKKRQNTRTSKDFESWTQAPLCRNRIHSIQRRVSKPFDRPRQVKKKKKNSIYQLSRLTRMRPKRGEERREKISFRANSPGLPDSS